EAVLPPTKPREDRNVFRDKRVFARPVQVAELAKVDELGHLGFTNDQLCAALDFSVVVGIAIRQRVAPSIHPLNDLKKHLSSVAPIERAHSAIVDTTREAAFFAASIHSHRVAT